MANHVLVFYIAVDCVGFNLLPESPMFLNHCFVDVLIASGTEAVKSSSKRPGS